MGKRTQIYKDFETFTLIDTQKWREEEETEIQHYQANGGCQPFLFFQTTSALFFEN